MKAELQLAFILGLAAFLLLMGGALLLTGLGLIPSDEPPGIVGRVLLVGFGMVIGGVGATVLLSPLRLLAEYGGATGWPSAIALGLARLLARVDARSLGSAALLAPLTLGYWGALHGTSSFGWSTGTLIDLVTIEFLLIHGFPFLVLAASLARVPDPWPRRAGVAATVGLILLYSAFALGFGGVWGIASLLYLMVPNTLAFARPTGVSVMITAGVRWTVQLVSFIGLAILLDERNLRGDGNLRIGFLYFALLLSIELFRVSEIPLDLGPAWARIPLARRVALVPISTDG